MKLIKWTDRRGFRHLSWLRDGDDEGMAAQGIPNDPPDLGVFDWEELRRELHNWLVDNGLVSWADLQKQPMALTSCLHAVFKKRIIGLYRDRDKKEEGE